MDKMTKMMVLVTGIVAVILGAVAFVFHSILLSFGASGGVSSWIGFFLWLALMILFIYKSIREIEIVHVGVLVFMGKRTNKVLPEGWHYLPLYPIVFRVALIKAEKNNKDLPEQQVRTPDYAESGVKIGLTWMAGSLEATKEEQASLLQTFLNSGGREGVERIMVDVVSDRLRMWTFSKEEGPATWQELMGATDETVAVLIRAILGDNINHIPYLPTDVLLRYYNIPQKPPLEYQKAKWGKIAKNGSEWERLEAELGRLRTAGHLDELESAVRERQRIIKEIKEGNGRCTIKSLGITLNRFTMTVELKGGVADAATKRAQEVEERAAERTETNHFVELVTGFRRKKFSNAEAAEMAQIALGKFEKVKKTKDEKKHEISVSPELIKAIRDVLGKP